MVENAVRSRPAAASSAIEISRLQKISSVTGSKASALALWLVGLYVWWRVDRGMDEEKHTHQAEKPPRQRPNSLIRLQAITAQLGNCRAPGEHHNEVGNPSEIIGDSRPKSIISKHKYLA